MYQTMRTDCDVKASLQLCTFISQSSSSPPPPSLKKKGKRYIQKKDNSSSLLQSSRFASPLPSNVKCCESCAWKEERKFQAKRLQREEEYQRRYSSRFSSLLRTWTQRWIDSLFLTTENEPSSKRAKRNKNEHKNKTNAVPPLLVYGRLPCRNYILSGLIIPILLTITLPFLGCNTPNPAKNHILLVSGVSVPTADDSPLTNIPSSIPHLFLIASILSIVFVLTATRKYNNKATTNTTNNGPQLEEILSENESRFDDIKYGSISTTTTLRSNHNNKVDVEDDPNNSNDNHTERRRQTHYASILSNAIQCKTISYDTVEKDENGTLRNTSRMELKKLHQVLRKSFPCLFERFPPVVVNEYSLVFKITKQEDDGGGVANSSSNRKPILLCSHLDVVRAPTNGSDLGEWKRDPFGGDIVDGVVWGRGAIDNKHNVIGQLGAIEEMLSSNQLPTRTIYIALGHDEEIGGSDGARNIANHLKEQDVTFDFILDEGTMIVSGGIPGMKDPVAMIGTVEKGHMCVEMSITGKGGHSSMPPINEDSLLKVMSQAVLALEANPIPAHFEKGSVFRNTLAFIATHMSFPMNVICSNLWLFGPLLKVIVLRASNGAAACVRTTTAITRIQGGEQLNMLPNEIKVYINHRLHPDDTFESVFEHDRQVVNDSRIKLKIIDDYRVPPSPDSGFDTEGFRLIESAVTRVFGNISTPAIMLGNTDTKWYWDLSDKIYRFSPVQLTMEETAMFHGVNERLRVGAMVSVVDFYKTLLSECDEI